MLAMNGPNRQRMGMIIIDGSQGEGGGHVLRTALCLSMVTGSSFQIVNIRARRARPGLRRQHLTAVQAAQAVSSASVEGARLGASEITFLPRKMLPGNYAFDIGTAGSTTLIAQTLIPPLVLASAPSRIRLGGGTHNPMSPPFEALNRSYLPVLSRMGASVQATLLQPGFYPAGGGRIELRTAPVKRLTPIDLSSRGALVSQEAHAVTSHLPRSIADRELGVIRDALGWPDSVLHAHDEKRAKGPGNVVIVVLVFEQITEVFTAFGQRGVRAEVVAGKVAKAARNHLSSNAAVGPHLADQLLVPISLAGGGRFTTVRPSTHTMTNKRIIEMYLPVKIDVEETDRDLWSITVRAQC